MNQTINYIQSGKRKQIKHFVLLSRSPRRAELLSFLRPKIGNVNVDERAIERKYMEKFQLDPFIERVGKTCCEISRAKAGIPIEEGIMYIAADTMVVMDDKIYNKPKDLSEARKMLVSYFGRTHQVVTSVCLRTRDFEDTFYTVADVEFVPYYSELSVPLNDYLKVENVMDKAGAYGIQDIDPRFIKGISGDINSIIGVPTAEVALRIYY